MSTISAIENNLSSNSYSRSNSACKRWDYFKNLASIVCSRESTYRTALDITAFDIPVMFADAFRGPKKFIETSFETLTGALTIFLAPQITSFVGNVFGKFLLPKNMQKNTSHYLRFSMQELRDFKSFSSAASRIKNEECEDKNFVASLYTRSGNLNKANQYKEELKGIEEFCNSFIPSAEVQNYIYKLKKATIVGESFIEGIWWGGTGLIIRAFRKYILREGRFTGTLSYATDNESEALGEAGDLNIFQKIVGLIAIPLGSIINAILLIKAEDEKLLEKNNFLKTVRTQFDMTHAFYPKIGLLFSMIIIPKYVGVLTTSQGWYERFERLLKLVTIVPSWWLGHRVTNGLFALNADNVLSKKYKVQPGILVEREYLYPKNKNKFFRWLNQTFPEPAKIHHVLKETSENKKLQDEAEDLHARCLYKGFTLHSILVWIISMGVNYTTKLRVQNALGK